MPSGGAAMRRLRDDKYQQGKLYDVRGGKPCRAMVLIEENLFLSPLTCEEIQRKIEGCKNADAQM